MIKLSTGLREELAVAGALKDVLDGGFLRLYSGPVPADADAALSGVTLLNEISAGGTGTPLNFEGTAPGGVLVKSVAETWTGDNLAGGTPTFFRYVLSGDAGDASSSAVRFQGSAGALGSDMFISVLPLVDEAPLSFSVFQLTLPAQ